MTQLQIAKVSFELKTDSPKESCNAISDRIILRDTPFTVDNKGRIHLTTSGAGPSQTTRFKSTVKAFRKGGIAERDILFPIRIGNVSYINTIPTATHLNILFRHDSIIANNYNRESQDSGKPHFQPPFYFFVKVSINNGEKQYIILNSPYSVEQRMFPHNERSNGVTSRCCDGAYSDQLSDALKTDNLAVFLSVFGGYISDGTQREDEYGRSCRNFTETYRAQNREYVIRDLLEAKLFAYSISDPEVPFKYDMSEQHLTVKFNSHKIQKMFFSTVATLSDKITAEEVIP